MTTRTLTTTRTRTDGDFHGGPGGDQAVQWCRGCGAYRRVFDPFGERREGEWRVPAEAEGARDAA
jgi:hypothetical protein